MSDETIAERELNKEDERNIVDLITDQLEFANVIVINKADLISPYKLEETKRVIKKLNPEAKIIATSFGKIEPEEILNTGLFDFEKASMGAGWQKELDNEHTPETDEYGIGSFVYRTRLPFNLQRFEDYINDKWHAGILRSKGFFWVSAFPSDAMVWSQSGQMSNIEKAGVWWVSLPLKQRNQHPAFQSNEEMIMNKWDKTFGDRLTELVFIGQDMPEKKIRAALDNCLCSEGELKKLGFSKN